MQQLMYMTLGCVAAMQFATSARAQEGVDGTTIRPMQENAKVEGCTIAKTGDYEVTVGDLIAIDYTYPVIPAAIPKIVDYKQTMNEAVAKSSLGFRAVTTPRMVGTGTIAFYFEAKKEGEEIVTLIIDGAEYSYKFTVVAAGAEERNVVKVVVANDTSETIFFFVNGLHGSTKKIVLNKDGIMELPFFDDRNERSLAAFDKNGNKVVSLFKFVPGNFCLLIEKNQTQEKTAAFESRKPTTDNSDGEPR